jgi:hypothetical protein
MYNHSETKAEEKVSSMKIHHLRDLPQRRVGGL